ncbi:hypothetical protein [Specibacter sp. NPDC078709]|uniref:hypothetical protein n=1 Tax=Specibacter sp. NPDC078709 TaxID=3154364 RepID=UPI00343E90A8
MRKILVTALAAAVFVVLFASAQGTAALWRAEAQLEPGAITTGTLSLAAGDGVTNEQNFGFSSLNTSVLAPGGFVQAPLTISNTGTTALTYTLAGAHSVTTAPSAADTELAGAVVLSIHGTAEAAVCTADSPSAGVELYQGSLSAGAAFAQGRELAPDATETLCVRVALPEKVEPIAAGGSIELQLGWRGDQL